MVSLVNGTTANPYVVAKGAQKDCCAVTTTGKGGRQYGQYEDQTGTLIYGPQWLLCNAP
jgi:hypothetical protein